MEVGRIMKLGKCKNKVRGVELCEKEKEKNSWKSSTHKADFIVLQRVYNKVNQKFQRFRMTLWGILNFNFVVLWIDLLIGSRRMQKGMRMRTRTGLPKTAHDLLLLSC